MTPKDQAFCPACGTRLTMDSLRPLLLNDSNSGVDWKAHGVTAGTVYGRKSRIRLGFEKRYEATGQIIRDDIRKGNLPE